MTQDRTFARDLPLFLAAAGVDCEPEAITATGFFESFSPELTHRCEFSIDPGERSLGLLCGGKGSPFEEKLAAFMEAAFPAEAQQAQRSAFQRVHQYFPGVGILLKSDFTAQRAPNVSIYYQYPLPLKAAPRFFKALGIGPSVAERVHDIGSAIEQRTFFTALDIPAEGPPAYGFIFTAPVPVAPAVLEQLFLLFHPELARGIRHHHHLQELGGGVCYVSVAVRGDAVLPTIKIDYEKITLPVALDVEKQLGVELRDELLEALSAMEIRNPTYFGLRHRELVQPRGKLYFIRPYMSAMEDLAEALKETHWV